MAYRMAVMAFLFQTLWQFSEHNVNPRCECLVFSRTFSKNFGTFSSPDYPKPYPTMIECLLYTFLANENEVVEVTFKDFNVYKSDPSCLTGDYVRVYAHVESGQVNEHTPWDNILCGKYSEVPHVLYSSVPALVLEFHTAEESSNSSGFIGAFRFIDKRMFETEGRQMSGSQCDLQFDSGNSSRSGRFFSPRYPASYPRPSHCLYHFKARADERIKLVFEEVSLQKGDDSCINRQDVIKIHDGWDSSFPNLLVICNEATDIEVYSTGSHLYVEFDAKDRRPGQGFKASYYFQNVNDVLEFKKIQQAEFGNSISENSIPENVLQKMGPQMNKLMYNRGQLYPLSRGSCDVYFRSKNSLSGIFTSPLYPKSYPSSTKCLFVFQAQGRERVQIIFEDLNLYYSNRGPNMCLGADSISVYTKMEGRIERLFTSCGNEKPAPVMSSGPILVVEFIANFPSPNVRGFKATYRFTQDFGITSGKQLSVLPCAFQFNSTEVGNSGEFSSPNFPGYYPRSIECHYFFYGNSRQRIRISFIYFDVEGISPCDENSESDYVELSNYMAHDRAFARHCGNLTMFRVISDRNFFRVSFRSNGVLDGTGFRATYEFLNDVSTQREFEKEGKATGNENRKTNIATKMDNKNAYRPLISALLMILLHIRPVVRSIL